MSNNDETVCYTTIPAEVMITGTQCVGIIHNPVTAMGRTQEILMVVTFKSIQGAIQVTVRGENDPGHGCDTASAHANFTYKAMLVDCLEAGLLVWFLVPPVPSFGKQPLCTFIASSFVFIDDEAVTHQ